MNYIIINMKLTIMMTMRLEFGRTEMRAIKDDWTLVYGRRKVGKTYMLRHFLDWDLYVHIGREGTIWFDGERSGRSSSFMEMTELITRMLREGKKVVLDEFQRVPLDYLERITVAHPSGSLVLSGSSMGMIHKVINPRSPLLGFFKEVRIDLIEHKDIFSNMPDRLGFEYVPYLRDPWVIPHLHGKDIIKDLHEMITSSVQTVPSLIGEIFHEEERTLSRTYNAILASVGSGMGRPSEIATYLYGKGLLKKDSSSEITTYISVLKDMGLLKEVPIFGMKRSIYRIGSPIIWVHYYMESLYDLDRPKPELTGWKENILRVHSMCMEDFLVELLSKALYGHQCYSMDPEIDGVILDHKDRPMVFVEVKWGRVRNRDVESFLEKTGSYDTRKVLISKTNVKVEGLEVLTPSNIMKIIMDQPSVR